LVGVPAAAAETAPIVKAIAAVAINAANFFKLALLTGS
jgi:hypothetical protein